MRLLVYGKKLNLKLARFKTSLPSRRFLRLPILKFVPLLTSNLTATASSETLSESSTQQTLLARSTVMQSLKSSLFIPLSTLSFPLTVIVLHYWILSTLSLPPMPMILLPKLLLTSLPPLVAPFLPPRKLLPPSRTLTTLSLVTRSKSTRF